MGGRVARKPFTVRLSMPSISSSVKVYHYFLVLDELLTFALLVVY